MIELKGLKNQIIAHKIIAIATISVIGVGTIGIIAYSISNNHNTNKEVFSDFGTVATETVATTTVDATTTTDSTITVDTATVTMAQTTSTAFNEQVNNPNKNNSNNTQNSTTNNSKNSSNNGYTNSSSNTKNNTTSNSTTQSQTQKTYTSGIDWGLTEQIRDIKVYPNRVYNGVQNSTFTELCRQVATGETSSQTVSSQLSSLTWEESDSSYGAPDNTVGKLHLYNITVLRTYIDSSHADETANTLRSYIPTISGGAGDIIVFRNSDGSFYVGSISVSITG